MTDFDYDDPDRPLCCALSRFGYRCTLPIGHEPRDVHQAEASTEPGDPNPLRTVDTWTT